MGKPVIVTQSLGQTDVIEDRRAARDKIRPRGMSLTQLFAAHAGLAIEANGFYVAPGDAAGLRRSIDYLLAHPDERARLGRAGRHMAEQLFTVEQFAERIRGLVLASVTPTADSSIVRRASYG